MGALLRSRPGALLAPLSLLMLLVLASCPAEGAAGGPALQDPAWQAQ